MPVFKEGDKVRYVRDLDKGPALGLVLDSIYTVRKVGMKSIQLNNFAAFYLKDRFDLIPNDVEEGDILPPPPPPPPPPVRNQIEPNNRNDFIMDFVPGDKVMFVEGRQLELGEIYTVKRVANPEDNDKAMVYLEEHLNASWYAYRFRKVGGGVAEDLEYLY